MKPLLARRPLRTIAGGAAALAVVATIAGCGGGTSLSSGGTSSPATGGAPASDGGGTLKTLKLAMVSSLDTEPYFYAKQHGYYKQAGLNVTFSSSDSGPALVTGVINGTYDAGSTAAFPLLIAIAKGAPLKLEGSLDTVSPGHGNSGLVVRPGSSITGFKDLKGKTIATNALTSLTTLATKIGMEKAGVDPSSAKIISLPFKSAIQAVARKQADAAVVISPFFTEAAMNGLKVIADPIGTMMPQGSPYGVLFTSAKTAGAKAKEFAAFNKATNRAVTKLKADPALQRELAHSEVGLTKAVAAKVPLPAYDTTINVPALQKYADLVAKYGYSTKAVDVKTIVAP